MGQAKQLLPFGGSTLLETVIDHFADARLDGLVVVTNENVRDALGLTDHARYRVAIQPDPDAEMLDTILLGVRRLLDVYHPAERDGILVCPGDMPSIDARLLQVCAHAFCENPGAIIVATQRNKFGHPIIFPVGMTVELETLRGVGLRGLLDVHADRLVTVSADPGTQHDIDTPADYRRAIE